MQRSLTSLIIVPQDNKMPIFTHWQEPERFRITVIEHLLESGNLMCSKSHMLLTLLESKFRHTFKF